ncbi:MAG: 2OG-Fe(II) oxygenase, partial [Burkholderiales bacterium]
LLKDISFALQDAAVIHRVSAITGVEVQVADPSLYAGGLSMMGRGHFLNPHIDNSHEESRRLYRTVNLLYYVTPGWRLENGGNLELWDRAVRRNATIVSQFNRLVLMETTPWSWHSVSPVAIDRFRCCVSNYYFSPRSPTGQQYFNVTSFSARPEQKMRRLIAWADGKLRNAVRIAVPRGLGRKDTYGDRPPQ